MTEGRSSSPELPLWQRGLNSEAFQHSLIAIFDQALCSATNLFVALILIRNSSTSDYGRFALANAGLFLALGTLHALVSAPLSVIAPKRSEREAKALVGSMAITHLLVALPLALLVALGSMALSVSGHITYGTASLMAISALVALPFVGREFIRQAGYIFSRPGMVVLVDLVYCGILLVLIGLFAIRTDDPALGTIQSIGIAATIAMCVGAVFLYKQLGIQLIPDRHSLSQLGSAPKWGGLGMFVSWLQNQGFLYLVGGIGGTAAVAHVSASRLLLMPIGMILTALGSVLRPRATKWLQLWKLDGLIRRIGIIALGTALLAIAYCIALWLGRAEVGRYAFDDRIVGLETLIIFWALFFVVQSLRNNFMIALQVLERFDLLFYLALGGGLAALPAIYFGVHAWQSSGSVLGLVFGEVVYLVGILYFLVRNRREARRDSR